MIADYYAAGLNFLDLSERHMDLSSVMAALGEHGILSRLNALMLNNNHLVCTYSKFPVLKNRRFGPRPLFLIDMGWWPGPKGAVS